MAETSLIEWTDATWNPVTGCSVVSPGCKRCYAMKLAGTRMKHHPSRVGLTIDTDAGPVWNGQVRLNETWLTLPLLWKRARRIFVCAHGDLFHESVPDAWIDRVFAVMALAPQHTFQVLTKRSARMRAYFADRSDVELNWKRALALLGALPSRPTPDRLPCHPLPNVWLGVSAEDQTRADERIPDLLATPATVRFLSAEPLLGAIDLTRIFLADPTGRGPPVTCDALKGWYGGALPDARTGLDWVIVGGESGPGARPIHPDWARHLRDQCAAADVPFFFKQWGEWAPVSAIPDTDQFYHPAPARHPEATRRCKVDDLVMHADGRMFRGEERYGVDAYAADKGAMMMMEIGKGAAGRLLDGAEHNGLPR